LLTKRKLNIDRAIYLADDKTRTYIFLERNPEWSRLGDEENETNKKSIDGYTRIFRDGRKKVFRFR
jgi:hypothetical protein